MLTLLLTPRETEETRRMASAARLRGLLVRQPERWIIPDHLDPANTLVYGGELFVELACATLGLRKPVVSPAWLPNLPATLLGRAVRLTTFAAARANPTPAFVKPVQDKCFPAAVYPTGAALPLHVDDSELVYVAEPVTFLREYRYFLLDGIVLTGSTYAEHGVPAAHEASSAGYRGGVPVAEGAFRATAGLDRAAVIDVGEIAGGRHVVVEANALPESALYGADEHVVLVALARAYGHDARRA
jgi:hypothetical protein